MNKKNLIKNWDELRCPEEVSDLNSASFVAPVVV
jgi:hypothetical protein